MSRPRIILIAAVAENNVIGADGDMPWRLPADLRRFRQYTLGKPVVMGRRTFDALGKPLDGRRNIVVSRNPDYRPPGAEAVTSLDAAFALAAEDGEGHAVPEIMVIGGGQLYRMAIGRADRLYITHVLARPEGDTLFPEIDPAVWQMVHEENHPAAERDSAATRFAIYDRLPAD